MNIIPTIKRPLFFIGLADFIVISSVLLTVAESKFISTCFFANENVTLSSFELLNSVSYFESFPFVSTCSPTINLLLQLTPYVDLNVLAKSL